MIASAVIKINKNFVQGFMSFLKENPNTFLLEFLIETLKLDKSFKNIKISKCNKGF